MLAIVTLLVWVAALFVPPGSYTRDADGSPIPGTYRQIESPLSLDDRVEQLVLAPVNGIYGLLSPVAGFVDTQTVGRLFGTSNGQILTWNAAIPAWVATNTLGVASGGTGFASYAVGDLLCANGTTTLSKRAIGATGTVLTSIGGVPQWAAPAASGTVTSVSSSTTLSGLTLSTATGTTTPAISLTGTLGVGSGGTGATTLTGYVKGSGTATLTASATIPVADVDGAAPLDSPAFTGTPTASTAAAGTNTTQLSTTAFVTAAVAASSGAPYDLPLEIPGTPTLSTKVVNFSSVRPFILATTGHQGGQLTNPSGNFVCTVRKNSTTLGTITFAAGGFSSSITGTLAERTFAAGDVLSVETPAAALGIDTPFCTFLMSLV
jgi:hypothetical protein